MRGARSSKYRVHACQAYEEGWLGIYRRASRRNDVHQVQMGEVRLNINNGVVRTLVATFFYDLVVSHAQDGVFPCREESPSSRLFKYLFHLLPHPTIGAFTPRHLGTQQRRRALRVVDPAEL